MGMLDIGSAINERIKIPFGEWKGFYLDDRKVPDAYLKWCLLNFEDTHWFIGSLKAEAFDRGIDIYEAENNFEDDPADNWFL